MNKKLIKKGGRWLIASA
ncbi:MAG TPA: hypothetical protein ENI33_08175 [Thermoplasmatales archaeon]|nr:hypothetical protein [Thermoplasmatales archaeon]